MKSNYILISVVLFFAACGEKKDHIDPALKTSDPATSSNNTVRVNENLEKWLRFYRAGNPDFSFDRFALTDSATINYNASNVPANFEMNFNKVYEPFLVYSPDRKKYIDFNSYHWIPDENGNPGFEADQQVTLVHLPSKNVRQLAFFGPSFTIEEAFWEGDSIAVLLGNTYEKVPFYIRNNLNRNMKYTYRYPDTLTFEKSYIEERLKLKGIGGK